MFNVKTDFAREKDGGEETSYGGENICPPSGIYYLL